MSKSMRTTGSLQSSLKSICHTGLWECTISRRGMCFHPRLLQKSTVTFKHGDLPHISTEKLRTGLGVQNSPKCKVIKGDYRAAPLEKSAMLAFWLMCSSNFQMILNKPKFIFLYLAAPSLILILSGDCMAFCQ